MTDIASLGIKVDASSADSAGSALDRLRTRARGAELAVGAMRAAFAGVAAAGAAFTAVVGKVTTVQREFDVLNSSLVTVTGSAQAAERNFAWIREFAATTPYSLNEVTGAFVKLKALGLDASRDALESYGNTASAMGKSLDQFIEAVADASTGEFERLKEFGIKARQDGATVAFTFRGITTTVRNSADEIESYLRRIGNVDFAGAMDLRAQTLDGALSNLGDTWDELFRTISNQGVGQLILDGVRAAEQGVRGLIDALNDMSIAAKSGQDFLTFLGRGTGLKTLDDDLAENVQKITEINEKLIKLQQGGGINETFNQRRIDALKRERAELEAEGKILEREAERRRKLRAPAKAEESDSGGPRSSGAGSQSKSELAALRKRLEDEQKLRILAADQILGTDDAQLRFNADVARAYEDFDRRRAAANDEAIRQANAQEDAVASLAERYRDLADPTRQYRQEIELVTALEAQGRLTAEEAFNARGRLLEQEASAADGATKRLKEQKSAVEELGVTFSSALEDAIVNFKSLGEVATGVLKDIARYMVRKQITGPLIEALGALFPGSNTKKSADGNAFTSGGYVSAFASGGAFGNGEVLTRPTFFRFASGGAFRSGVAGEAGPEGALPLKRMANGKLGVYAEAGSGPTVLNVRVINNAGAQVQVAQNNEGGLDVLIDQIDQRIASGIVSGRGRTAQAMQGTFGLNRARAF
ncbi:hypothetical protein METUNv1_01679 [Methyloversatilis universalis FAM5]|uniref:Tape measure protein N-terminal domain-containing protein n=1 Tax=Methyloversatilis universalis (strain ATCC BAA-1314 / DSM 25237 / JCM 13912 / CCUG 52030 / FAM5) TaxID=1000565 RepID=F5RC38_METUF|nr:tape measure protein [Methyloversatilis universalis]EGK71901.1 hypothetical protein METUNv1_01679 [Methyloversatilis universalis FAM5]